MKPASFAAQNRIRAPQSFLRIAPNREALRNLRASPCTSGIKQDRKEQEARRKFEGGRKSGKWENRSPELTAELVGRFEFIVKGMELIQGRPALRLDFRPRIGELPAKRLADRVINKLAGTVWVDEREFEIVRANLKLIEPVTLWGGVLGALDAFELP